MAANFSTILGSVGGLFQQVQAANITASAAESQAQTIRVGGEIAAQGAQLTAAGYRQSAKSVKDATKFNLAIDRININKRLSASSRQFQRLLGQQLSQQAGSGSLTGKSFLMVRNETLDAFGKGLLDIKIAGENSLRAKQFESDVKQTTLENQARASDFRAEAERTLAKNRAAEASYQGDIAKFKGTQSILKAAPTILGQIFN